MLLWAPPPHFWGLKPPQTPPRPLNDPPVSTLAGYSVLGWNHPGFGGSTVSLGGPGGLRGLGESQGVWRILGTPAPPHCRVQGGSNAMDTAMGVLILGGDFGGSGGPPELGFFFGVLRGSRGVWGSP